jgi:CRISPR-associated protein Cas6
VAQAVSDTWGDLHFATTGGVLPADYADSLWVAVCNALPWVADVPGAGVHPLRGADTEHGVVLSRRSKLTLRLPLADAGRAAALSGRCIEFRSGKLQVGEAVVKPLRSFPTLGARCVLMADALPGEIGFTAKLNEALFAQLGEAQIICGQPVQVIQAGRVRAGHSVVIHELTPSQSLTLLETGVGEARGLGCGLFTHHKVITGLNDDFDGPD